MATLIAWQRRSGYFKSHAYECQTINCCVGCSTGLRTCLRYAPSKNAFTGLTVDPCISNDEAVVVVSPAVVFGTSKSLPKQMCHLLGQYRRNIRL